MLKPLSPTSERIFRICLSYIIPKKVGNTFAYRPLSIVVNLSLCQSNILAFVNEFALLKEPAQTKQCLLYRDVGGLCNLIY